MKKLAQHFQSSSVSFFPGLSNKIQNDLIEAVGMNVENCIKQEITPASFIAIKVDEMIDVSCTIQSLHY